MFDAAPGIALMMVTSFGYLRRSRNIRVKRWMLPLTTAAVAALLANVLLQYTGQRAVDYSVMVPLALSAGLILQHLLDYCRRCGTARPLPRLAWTQAHGSGGCPGCRERIGQASLR